jgi:O-antigen ligase
VFFTYSRIAWVALPALVLALAFLKSPRAGLLALVISVLVGAGAWLASPTLQQRMGESNQDRYALWVGVVETFKDRPIAGVGFGRTSLYANHYSTLAMGKSPTFISHIHSNLLDALASTGLLGLLAHVGWWLSVFWMSWKAFRLSSENERWLPAACLAGFLAFNINGLTQVNFFDGKSQHTLMIWVGVALALYWRTVNDRERSGPH